tara:strand:- start:13393 stop:13701 length:309 start_codon:yes stop_codon:yes gene_type:complete
MSQIERIITLQNNEYKKKYSLLLSKISNTITNRHKNYLLAIHSKINDVMTDIDNLMVDIDSENNISPELLEEMKNYIIDEKVKSKFLPYMMVYRMQLENEYN